MSQNTTPDDDARRDRPADENPTTPLPPHETPTEQYPSHPAPAASDAAGAPAKKPAYKRGATWAIVGGGVAAALVLVGGGAALGAALAGDDRGPAAVSDRGPGGADDRAMPGPDDRDAAGPGSDRERPDPGAPGGPLGEGGPGGLTGSTDDGELTGIVAKARAADGAEGDATEIEARPGGAWEVRLETADGVETDVLVSSDGVATVRERDSDDDPAPTTTLSDSAISSIVDAALAEASGSIVKIEADDDAATPYEATVLLTDGGRMEIDLGADFAVVSTEVKP